MGSIQVVNKYKHEEDANKDIYIGRGSPLGNPYPINSTHDRDAVCDLYEQYFIKHVSIKNDPLRNSVIALYKRVEKGESINLICFCSPCRCHGDFIKHFVEKHLQKNNRS